MAQAPCKHHPGACTEAGSEEDKLRSSSQSLHSNSIGGSMGRRQCLWEAGHTVKHRALVWPVNVSLC